MPTSCRQRLAAAVLPLAAIASAAFAAHPLITDDAYTQGAGRFELQLGSQLTRGQAGGTTFTNFQFAPQLTYGVLDTLDVLARPAYNIDFATGAESGRASGFGDTFVGFKWRFLEWAIEGGQWATAVAGGTGLPTTSAPRGLDAGRATPYAYLVLMRSTETLQLQTNVGAIRNANLPEGRSSLAHVSTAAIWTPRAGLQLGIDLAADQNPSRQDGQWPAVALVGAIYTLNPFWDLDVGYQRRLNHSAPENQVLVGATVRW